LQEQDASGVLHVGAGEETPLENVAVFSKSEAELLARTGSRYSPAAPCEKLKLMQGIRSPGVFIGKPCDVVRLLYWLANARVHCGIITVYTGSWDSVQ
jgi:coenzyme F420 hydrogenase subunit beta